MSADISPGYVQKLLKKVCCKDKQAALRGWVEIVGIKVAPKTTLADFSKQSLPGGHTSPYRGSSRQNNRGPIMRIKVEEGTKKKGHPWGGHSENIRRK